MIIQSTLEPTPNPELGVVDQLRGDRAFPNPGKFKVLKCGVCGTNMDVQRDVYGPTSFGAAMGKTGRDHDAFHCPYSDDDWHQQAKTLHRAARETPSRILSDLFYREALTLCKTRQATKKVSRI